MLKVEKVFYINDRNYRLNLHRQDIHKFIGIDKKLSKTQAKKEFGKICGKFRYTKGFNITPKMFKYEGVRFLVYGYNGITSWRIIKSKYTEKDLREVGIRSTCFVAECHLFTLL